MENCLHWFHRFLSKYFQLLRNFIILTLAFVPAALHNWISNDSCLDSFKRILKSKLWRFLKLRLHFFNSSGYGCHFFQVASICGRNAPDFKMIDSIQFRRRGMGLADIQVWVNPNYPWCGPVEKNSRIFKKLWLRWGFDNFTMSIHIFYHLEHFLFNWA